MDAWGRTLSTRAATADQRLRYWTLSSYVRKSVVDVYRTATLAAVVNPPTRSAHASEGSPALRARSDLYGGQGLSAARRSLA